MIHDQHPRVKVNLVIDDIALDEYEDENAVCADPNTNSAFVEATSGSHFGIRLVVLQNAAPNALDSLSFAVYLDGKRAQTNVLDVSSASAHLPYIVTLKGIDRNTARGRVLEKFMFTEVDTNDGPVGTAKQDNLKHMGEVKVACTWVRKNGTSYITDDDKTFESQIASSVPEKCLKGRAISNRVSVAAPQLVGGPPIKYVDVGYLYGRNPFATFVFKYRSRRDLQIEGIIERDPTPVPLEERDPDDLTPAEARELVRRMRERQADQVRIKKEGARKKRGRTAALDADGNASDSDDVTITGVGPSRKRSCQSNDSAIEVIDLTED